MRITTAFSPGRGDKSIDKIDAAKRHFAKTPGLIIEPGSSESLAFLRGTMHYSIAYEEKFDAITVTIEDDYTARSAYFGFFGNRYNRSEPEDTNQSGDLANNKTTQTFTFVITKANLIIQGHRFETGKLENTKAGVKNEGE